jgi:hypothetical protein
MEFDKKKHTFEFFKCYFHCFVVKKLFVSKIY